jgi:predicted ATPase
MSDGSQRGFGNTELDEELLSTPYAIQTNWHVITGAPCSGKSTLISHLADLGYTTFTEIARDYFDREIAGGRTVDEIHANPAALQRGIRDMQLRFELELPARDLIFLDGALPGSLAWFRAFGLDPNESLAECFQRRYASVFVLNPLPFQHDEERVEGMAAIVAFLDEWLPRDYRALGYDILRVPVMPPQERLAFVLQKLSDLGLIW